MRVRRGRAQAGSSSPCRRTRARRRHVGAARRRALGIGRAATTRRARERRRVRAAVAAAAADSRVSAIGDRQTTSAALLTPPRGAEAVTLRASWNSAAASRGARGGAACALRSIGASRVGARALRPRGPRPRGPRTADGREGPSPTSTPPLLRPRPPRPPRPRPSSCLAASVVRHVGERPSRRRTTTSPRAVPGNRAHVHPKRARAGAPRSRRSPASSSRSPPSRRRTPPSGAPRASRFLLESSSAASNISSAAMNVSYGRIPTACERFRLVGPVPPVCPAPPAQARPGQARRRDRHRASFRLRHLLVRARPVRSFPNNTATFPRLTSSASIFRYRPRKIAVTSGDAAPAGGRWWRRRPAVGGRVEDRGGRARAPAVASRGARERAPRSHRARASGSARRLLPKERRLSV